MRCNLRWIIRGVFCGLAFAGGILLPRGLMAQEQAGSFSLGSQRQGETDPSSETRAQRKKVAEARAGVRKAESSLNFAHIAVHREFYNSREYLDAREALRAASRELEQTRGPILTALHNSELWQRCVIERDHAEAEVDAIRAQDKINFKQLTAAAKESMARRSVLSRMEAEALAREPKVAEALVKVQGAYAQLQAMESALDDRVRQNGEFADARKGLADARAKWFVENRELIEAIKEEARKKQMQAIANAE